MLRWERASGDPKRSLVTALQLVAVRGAGFPRDVVVAVDAIGPDGVAVGVGLDGHVWISSVVGSVVGLVW